MPLLGGDFQTERLVSLTLETSFLTWEIGL